MVLFLGISIGIFLFILFFQPFSIDRFDFNDKLLFIAGLGFIIFLFITLLRALTLWQFGSGEKKELFDLPFNTEGFILWAATTIAFAFYLRYVGGINITFHIMLKTAIICLAPPLILGVSNKIKKISVQNELLLKEKKKLLKRAEKSEGDLLNQPFEFVSEGGSESISIVIGDVVYVKSADNYVELAFQEGEGIKKKLIRNTLKNIEHQLNPFPDFTRCHRTCIVNTRHVKKLTKQNNSYWLSLKKGNIELPVSRQYLLKLKEKLQARGE
jgi:hypothetical protein